MKTKKMKANLIVIILVLTSAFYLAATFAPENAGATIRYVGGTDPGNYTTIQDAINDSIPGDSVYVYNGTYYEHVTIDKPLSLVGEDRDTTIIDGGDTGDVVNVIADWVNFTGFTVARSGVSGSDAGIELNSVQNCFVSGNNASNNEFGIHLRNSNNTTISDNDALDNKVGIILFSSNDNIIVGNDAHHGSLHGIFVSYSSGNTISGNNVSSNWFNGVSLGLSNENIIVNNTVFSNEDGISSSFSTGNIFLDNVLVENGFHINGDSPEHWNTHTLDTSNRVNGNPVYYWKNTTGGTVPPGAGQVILANCTNVIVENQNVSAASLGIALGFSFGNTITSNAVSRNTKGIAVEYSNDNTIANNTASDNDASIVLRVSNNTTVANNTVSGTDEGISLNSDSSNNTIVNNDVLDNVRGIYARDSNNNTLVNNSIYSNSQFGIYLISCYNNSIHHNILADNARQALDNTDANQWDNGYPSGGNYWNDYLGVDNCSGPNQDICPDPDEIGDTPYIIDPNSRDKYPLFSPPGIEHPRPPTLLWAVLSGGNMQNVSLNWSLSPDDGKGFKSAVGYRIYRNQTYDPQGLGYAFIASLSNGTSEFVDASVGVGDPSNYFYQVCAVDVSNNTTCAKDQAAKFTRPLAEGPNLLSIPLIQPNNSIDIVLQTVKWDKAWSYDSSIRKWKCHMKFKPYFGELERITHADGFWVNVTGESNLTVAGIVPSVTTIALHEGWNLVGFPSFARNYTVADLKSTVSVERVEAFDLLSPPFLLGILGETDFLVTGYGYWLRVNLDTTWVIRNA